MLYLINTSLHNTHLKGEFFTAVSLAIENLQKEHTELAK